jgi:hypothetical protein
MLRADFGELGDYGAVGHAVLQKSVRAVVRCRQIGIVLKVLARARASSSADSSEQFVHARVGDVKYGVDDRLSFGARVLSSSVYGEKEVVVRVGTRLADVAGLDCGSRGEIVAALHVRSSVAFEEEALV